MNQCDGCKRGLPVVNGIHQEHNGQLYMVCEKETYRTKRYQAWVALKDRFTTLTSVSAWRNLLVECACERWGGKENQNWKIVQNQTPIGFHAVEIATGEIIEIR